MTPWFVYLLSCADGSLYTGIARDPIEREAVHNDGSGAAYTRSRRPVRLVYVEPAADKSAALRRELHLKALSRKRKLELVATRSAVRCDAPLLSAAGFGAPHGFSTRAGGVSGPPWEGLNLGLNTDDDPAAIERNRQIFRSWFGDEVSPCALDQVHGDRIVEAGVEGVQEADAHFSCDPARLLVIGSADCLPILYFDPESGAVAAAHCGWRGTLAGLASKVVEALGARFGTDPAMLQVAIGPGICRRCYEVSEELAERFLEAGFSPACSGRGDGGRWRLDLVAANVQRLVEAGVEERSIFHAGGCGSRCTSCEPGLFYSHRRDRGATGRHWAAVRAPGA